MRLLLALIILCIFVCVLLMFNKNGRTYVKSDIDNELYLVVDLDDKYEAANRLATIKKFINVMVKELNNKKDNEYSDFKQYIERLSKNIVNVDISETPNNSNHTSYSRGKGDELVFCLRSKKMKNQFHDMNIILYVVLHELSHIACPEKDHTPLFIKIFMFLIKVAEDIGLYKKSHFELNPKEYCGMTISTSIG